jgi:NitT/TauT family transport system substrate-binding protein
MTMRRAVLTPFSVNGWSKRAAGRFPHPPWIPAFAGMTAERPLDSGFYRNGDERRLDSHGRLRWPRNDNEGEPLRMTRRCSIRDTVSFVVGGVLCMLMLACQGERPAAPGSAGGAAPALWGRATGSFEKELQGRIEWVQFNAGPSAIEALLAGVIDATYIGPNPAINGFLRSRGEGVVVIAGAASGGAALVVRPASGIASERDFHGKTVATPQLGNTQDVAARLWFAERGYVPKEKGGDLTILPLANPDQLLLMQKGEIDAAWTIEPWVSRLEREAGAGVLLEEKTLWPNGRYPTALLITRRSLLAERPEIVGKLLAAHVEATLAINAAKDGLAPLLAEEIKRETTKELPLEVVRSALARIELTWDPLANALQKSADDAHRVGFLPAPPKLAGLVDTTPLNQILRSKGLPPIGER